MTSSRYPGNSSTSSSYRELFERINFDLTTILMNTTYWWQYMDPIRNKGFRKSEKMLCKRFSDVLSQYNCDAFSEYVEIVRYYNRSYLVLKIYTLDNFDLVTNVFPKIKFPVGMSVELIKTKTFKNNVRFSD